VKANADFKGFTALHVLSKGNRFSFISTCKV